MFSFLLFTYSVTDHKTNTDGVLIKNIKSPLDKLLQVVQQSLC